MATTYLLLRKVNNFVLLALEGCRSSFLRFFLIYCFLIQTFFSFSTSHAPYAPKIISNYKTCKQQQREVWHSWRRLLGFHMFFCICVFNSKVKLFAWQLTLSVLRHIGKYKFCSNIVYIYVQCIIIHWKILNNRFLQEDSIQQYTILVWMWRCFGLMSITQFHCGW